MMNKLFLVATFLMSALAGVAQSSYSFQINHVALSVQDVDASAKFYKEVLLLEEITNRSKFPGIRWFDLGDGHELHLISIIDEEVAINKAVHLAMSTNQFDPLVKKLESLGVPYSDWPGTAQTISVRADGVRQIFFQDVDGYWIEVNNETANK